MPFDFKRLKHLKEIQPFLSCFIRGRSTRQQGMKQPKRIILIEDKKPLRSSHINRLSKNYDSSSEESDPEFW